VGRPPLVAFHITLDTPASPSRQRRELVLNLSVRSWISSRANEDPYVIAIDLEAVHSVVRGADVEAGDLALDRLAGAYHLETVGEGVIERIASWFHRIASSFLSTLILKRRTPIHNRTLLR